VLQHQLESSQDEEPFSKKTKISDSKPSTIADKLRSGSYTSAEGLDADIKSVCDEMMKNIKENQESQSVTSYGRPQMSNEDLELLAGVLAFQQVSAQFTSQIPATKLVNGTSEKVEKKEDDDLPAIDLSSWGKPVLTLFASAGGPKVLFSSFQNARRVESKSDGLDGSVEVTLPLRESALPNFISSTSIINPLTKSRPAKGLTFGERFPTPKSVPQLIPPKTTNKLLTKASTIGWLSEEAVSRSISRRTYNWCVTRLNTGRSLDYSEVHKLPHEPNSPEERRRQRDRALSTGSAQPPQSEAARIAAEQAKDEALLRNAFSSFAPCYDNSDAVVPTSVKTDLWWARVGHQRAARVFGADFEEEEEEEESEAEEDQLEDEEKVFKEAVENFDPAILEASAPFERKKDQDLDDILEEVSDLIETLYSYQKIRGSTISSTSAPMTPVGQRTALTESIGTPTTPSTAETEIYKTLQAQLSLLIGQLPPSAVTRLNGDKLQKLNISTTILVETEDAAGVLEEEPAPKPVADGLTPQAAQQRVVPRTTALAPARTASGYYQTPNMPRTPSASYPRPSGTPGYPAYPQTVQRAQYVQPQSGFNQAGYGQSPMRVNYQQSPQYFAQNQMTNRMAYAPNYQVTPQAQRQYPPQSPMQNYQRPAGYGYQQPATTPQIRTASPMQGPAGASPHFRNNSIGSGRTQYYPPATAHAIGPTGFHSSMTAQEQQAMIDRNRQIALQNQARAAAASQASGNVALQPAPSAYTTPSRHSSDTPQPVVGQGYQMNGTPK
jgi:hypothetical protein